MGNWVCSCRFPRALCPNCDEDCAACRLARDIAWAPPIPEPQPSADSGPSLIICGDCGARIPLVMAPPPPRNPRYALLEAAIDGVRLQPGQEAADAIANGVFAAGAKSERDATAAVMAKMNEVIREWVTDAYAAGRARGIEEERKRCPNCDHPKDKHRGSGCERKILRNGIGHAWCPCPWLPEKIADAIAKETPHGK